MSQIPPNFFHFARSQEITELPITPRGRRAFSDRTRNLPRRVRIEVAIRTAGEDRTRNRPGNYQWIFFFVTASFRIKDSRGHANLGRLKSLGLLLPVELSLRGAELSTGNATFIGGLTCLNPWLIIAAISRLYIYEGEHGRESHLRGEQRPYRDFPSYPVRVEFPVNLKSDLIPSLLTTFRANDPRCSALDFTFL